MGATPSTAAPAPQQPSALPGERESAATPTTTPLPDGNSTATSATTAGAALPGYPTLPASSTFSPGPFAAGLLLAALAAAAFVMARRRGGAPRLVQILEQTSLGPKRALVVARMGDELLVLGSSEGGIALLATRPAGATATATSSATSTANATAARRTTALPLAGAAVDLLARLKRRAPGASFDAALAESVEDAELRRKLAQGQRGSVR